MKPIKPDRGDDFLDHRLKGGIARTSSSLEARFENIRFQAQTKQIAERRTLLFRFPILAPLGAAAALTFAFWLLYPETRDKTTAPTAVRAESEIDLEDPYRWNEALSPALAALDPETLAAIYHFAHYENTH